MKKKLSLSKFKVFEKIENMFGYLNDEFEIDLREKETINLFFSNLINEGFELIIYGSKIMNYIKRTKDIVNDIDFLIFNSLHESEYRHTKTHIGTEVMRNHFVDIVKRSFGEININNNYPFVSLKINEIFDINYFCMAKNTYSFDSLGRVCGENWILKLNITKYKSYNLKLERAWGHKSEHALGNLDEIFNPFIKFTNIKKFQDEFENRIINHCYKQKNEEVINLFLKNLLFYNKLHVKINEFIFNENYKFLKVKQNIIHKSKELHNELDFFSSAFFDKTYDEDYSLKLNQIVNIYRELEQAYILISPDVTSDHSFSYNVKSINDLSYLQLNRIQKILLKHLIKQLFVYDYKLSRLDATISTWSLSSVSSTDSDSLNSKGNVDLDMTSNDEGCHVFSGCLEGPREDFNSRSSKLGSPSYDGLSKGANTEIVREKDVLLCEDKLDVVRNVDNLKKEKEEEIYLKLDSLQFLDQINDIKTSLDTFIKKNDLKDEIFVGLKSAIEIKKENLNLYYTLELYKYLRNPKSDLKQASLISYMKKLTFSHQKLEALTSLMDESFSHFQKDYYESEFKYIFSNTSNISVKKLNRSFNEFKLKYKVLDQASNKKEIEPKSKISFTKNPSSFSIQQSQNKIKDACNDPLEKKVLKQSVNKNNGFFKSFLLVIGILFYYSKFLSQLFLKNVQKAFHLLVKFNSFLLKSSVNGVCKIGDFLGNLKSKNSDAIKLIDKNPNNIPVELVDYKKDLNDIFHIVDIIEKSKADLKKNINYIIAGMFTWVVIMGVGMSMKNQNTLSRFGILSSDTEEKISGMIFSNYSHLITIFLFFSQMNLKSQDIFSFYEDFRDKLNIEIKECSAKIKLIEEKNLSHRQKQKQKNSLFDELENKVATLLEEDKNKAYFKKIINRELKKQTISKETLETFEI